MNQNSSMQQTQKEFQVDLLDFAILIWNKKLLIFSVTSSFAIFSVIFSLMLPNIYSSNALLAPT